MLKRDKTEMKKKEERDLKWFLVDATGKTLGRLASELTKILRGKHRADFTPHADTGDGIIVINADKIRVTGSKEVQKVYRHYTGYQNGLREIPYLVMKERKPEYILMHAVKGMMPKTKLARAQTKRLRIYAGEEHGMQAQKPIEVNM